MKLAVGIDIGTENVKAIIATRRGDRLRILGFACREAEDLASPGDILADLGTRGARVTSVLGTEHVAIRRLRLPEQLKGRMDQIVKYDAEDGLRLWDLDDLVVASIPGRKIDGEREVFAAASLRSDLEQHLANVGKRRGVRVTCSTSSLATLAKMCHTSSADPESVDEPTVLLTLGHAATDVLVLEHGELRSARRVPYGIARAQVSDNLDVAAYTARLARELKWSLAGLSLNQPVQSVQVTGGGALLPGVREAIEAQTGFEVDHWRPLVEFEDGVAEADRDAAMCLGSAAIGAAAENLFGTGVDFCRSARPVRSAGARVWSAMSIAAFLIGITLCGWAAMTFRQLGALEAQIGRGRADQRAAWAKLFPGRPSPPDVKLVLASEQRKVQQQHQHALPERHRPALDILLEIIELLPPVVKLDDADIRITQRTVTIHAETNSWASVELIEKAIGNAPTFQAVGKDVTALAPDRIRISLEVRISAPAPGGES